MLGVTGCKYKSGYVTIVERSVVDGIEYHCDTELDKKTDCFYSIISKHPDSNGQVLRLRGKPECLAVSSRNNVIAIGILPMEGPNEYGYLYLSDKYEIVFADTKTFKISHHWQVRPKGIPVPELDRLWRFDAMGFSDDGNTIATYYWKPNTDKGRQSVVTLWDVASGEPIQELFLPPPDTSLQGKVFTENADDLAFSPDGRLVALSGGWFIKDPFGLISQPDPFVVIWKLSDGSRITLRPKNSPYISDLCFDQTATQLTCLGGTYGKITSKANVTVWSVPECELLTTKVVSGRVFGIMWSTSENAFRVRLEDGTYLFVKHGVKE